MNNHIGVISFITHNSHLNYGATLHGWAFQHYLKSRYDVNTLIIRYIPKALQGENLKYPLFNSWKNPFKQSQRWYKYIFKRFLQMFNYTIQPIDNIRKWNKFQSFIDRNLKTTKLLYDYSDLQNISNIEDIQFKMFVCESDVIWKINSIEDIDENFFLSFPVANGCIKVAYAPSISSKNIEGEIEKKFRHLTKDFYAISARDEEGSKYLSKFLNRKVPHVLDPTMLLSEKDYLDIMIEPTLKEDYLLIYTCSSDDTRMVKEAVNFAKRNNLKPIEISNYAINRFMLNHEVKTSIGIEEWLGYMKNSKFIICNSFHGICFSVIFKKEFYVFQRDNSDFRIHDLMNSLGIKERMVSYDNKVLPIYSSKLDYETIYSKLSDLRKESDSFIFENIVKNINSIDTISMHLNSNLFKAKQADTSDNGRRKETLDLISKEEPRICKHSRGSADVCGDSEVGVLWGGGNLLIISNLLLKQAYYNKFYHNTLRS